MPNVVIVGVTSGLQNLIGTISQIVTGLGIEGSDGVVTYFGNTWDGLPRISVVDMTKKRGYALYLIVRDTKKSRAMLIAETLNKKLNIDVEVEIIHAFLPKRK